MFEFWTLALDKDKILEAVKDYHKPQTTNPKILPNANAFLDRGISVEEIEKETKLKAPRTIYIINLLQHLKVIKKDGERRWLLDEDGKEIWSFRWLLIKSILKYISPLLISIIAVTIALFSMAVNAIVYRREIVNFLHSKFGH